MMRICGRCRKEVSQEATSCPHCGAMFKPKAVTPPQPPIYQQPTYQPPAYQYQQPPMQSQGYQYPVASEKSFVALLLLCMFLGGVGAHRFYAGKQGSAVAMLLLTIFSPCLLFIPVIVTGIWSIVDFIVILCGNFTDADGLPIKTQ